MPIVPQKLTSWQWIATKAGFCALIWRLTCVNHWGMRLWGSSKIEPTLAVTSRMGKEVPLANSDLAKSKHWGLLAETFLLAVPPAGGQNIPHQCQQNVVLEPLEHPVFRIFPLNGVTEREKEMEVCFRRQGRQREGRRSHFCGTRKLHLNQVKGRP